MEFTLTEEYNKEKNILRKKLITGCLGRNVDVDIYKSVDNTFTRVHISDENVSKFEAESIKHILAFVKDSHRFLCSYHQEAIVHLMKINPAYSEISNMWNVFYYDSDKLTVELQEFAHMFISRLGGNIISIPSEKTEIENILNLDSVGLMDCELENTNGRLYLLADGEKHHMDYENTVDAILNDEQNVVFHLRSKYDRINLLRTQMGASPVKLFKHFEITERCRLMIAMTKICKENNLPVREDITNFMYKEQGYLYYTSFFDSTLQRTAKTIDIDNFKKYEFDDLEEALAFIIHLCINDENYILLYGNRFTVCYNSTVTYSAIHVPSQMKQYIPELINCENTPYNLDVIHDSSLSDLFKYKVVRGNITGGSNVHIDPHDGNPLPIEYYMFEGLGLRCISGLTKPPVQFDREHFNLKPVEIKFAGAYIVIGDITIKDRKFQTKSRDMIIKYANSLWKKGYFLTIYGMMYYIEYEIILPHCIFVPQWFTIEDSNVEDLERFIKFNFSEYLEES
jgi:hypothetical protein